MQTLLLPMLFRGLVHAENGQEGQFARKNLRSLRPAVQMAQKMGKRLGRCAILFGPLPVEAQSLNFNLGKLVGTTGFEPATPTPPVWCATRLRYVPTASGRAAPVGSARIWRRFGKSKGGLGALTLRLWGAGDNRARLFHGASIIVASSS